MTAALDADDTKGGTGGGVDAGTTPGRAFLDQRIDLLVAGRTDEMVDHGYNDDALLVGFESQVRGREALKEYFRSHISNLGGVRLKAIDSFAESDDAIFVELTVVTGRYGEVTSYESFVLRDGRADHHFSVVR